MHKLVVISFNPLNWAYIPRFQKRDGGGYFGWLFLFVAWTDRVPHDPS